jgi:hypothetical protein
MMLPRPGALLALSWALATASAHAVADDVAVDFSREIRPILARHCLPCHGPDAGQRKAALRLDTREGATATLEDGAVAIVPGDPDASDLIFRVTEEDPTVRMPPKKAGAPLKPDEIDLLRRWIAQGADYAPHWAFVPPRERSLPTITHGSWARNPIDVWIAQRLERAALEPSAEADRATLLRRLSLDVRGLPPTPFEVRAFEDDPSPDAYERAVDRLLADPAFGERWARVWLDLARYADSAGFGSDPLRPNMWRYRDWVIDAFNANLPYSEFVVEQIAGDLLPGDALGPRMATAFHRNTMTNTEGGTDDEEFRIAAIKDRVDTTGQVFMGLTFGCAKCHTHKFDPITIEEYYGLFAVFNQSADNDQPDERPVMPAPTPVQQAELSRIEAEIAPLKDQLDRATPALADAQARWEASLGQPATWTPLTPVEVRSESGTTFEIQGDGSIRATGENPKNEVYTLVARIPRDSAPITALRLEALPDPDLPGGGPGRAPDGNFVLSRVAVEVEPDPVPAGPPVARLVRIELPGPGRMLSLAEVEVVSEGCNVAERGDAQQSSTAFDGPAQLAIDGNTDGHYFDARSTTHTREEANPWWEVRLAEPAAIERIVVWNRTDGGLGNRLAGARVLVLDDARQVVWQTELRDPPSPSRELTPTSRRSVPLARAFADFSQGGFDVANLLKPATEPGRGWAIAPQFGKAHESVLIPEEPIAAETSRRLVVRLEHRSKDAGHTLGKFRVAITTDPNAARRAAVPADVLAIVDTPANERTPREAQSVAAHFRSIAPELEPIRARIAALEKAKPAVPTLPVMVELPAEKRRVTRVLNKGNFLDPGAAVEPGVPSAFHPLSDGAPRDRLGLARWLVDPRNPLTARVAVNRLWAQLFGTGIVETEEDFGTQGELPSHPELLDWLAQRYEESGWDTKAMLRLIVTSAAYRQSSRVTPEALARDPRNRLLGRAPRLRLEAEMVRDQALALSGLLSRKLGGPSVFPPQPEGLWQAAFNGERTWATSTGDDRYRRGLYTFWRRTVPYPSMATFDAPSREVCTVKRTRTNTPLQALVTLNDPVFVEAAQALARRIVIEGGITAEDRARFALTLCLGRRPADDQVRVLIKLYEDEAARYRDDPAAALAMATEPLGPLPEGLDPADVAAWTSVANVLLNLDGVLTRG